MYEKQHTFALSLSWLFLIKSLAKLGPLMSVQVCTKDRLCGPWCCPQGFEFSKSSVPTLFTESTAASIATQPGG